MATAATASTASTARTELVGKRVLFVAAPETATATRGRPPRSARPPRTPPAATAARADALVYTQATIRCASDCDDRQKDLQVLVEVDGESWSSREWLSVYSNAFRLFLVEDNLVLASRSNAADALLHPALTFRPLVDRVGFNKAKFGPKPVEFLTDLKIEFKDYANLRVIPDWDVSIRGLDAASANERAVKTWSELQASQQILLTTPSVLLGYRLQVYRAEGTTQWFSAVATGYNQNTQEFSLTDDNVLQEHFEDPRLVQMKIIGDGVVDAILRGEDVGCVPRRSRTAAANANATSVNAAHHASLKPQSSRDSKARAPSPPRPPPASRPPSTPTASGSSATPTESPPKRLRGRPRKTPVLAVVEDEPKQDKNVPVDAAAVKRAKPVRSTVEATAAPKSPGNRAEDESKAADKNDKKSSADRTSLEVKPDAEEAKLSKPKAVAVVRPQRQVGQQEKQLQKDEEQQAGHNRGDDGKSQATAGRNLKDLISLYDFFDTDEECNNSVESSKGRKTLKKKSPSSSGRVLKSGPARSNPAKKFSEVFPSKATQSSPPSTVSKEEVASKSDSSPEKSSPGASQNADCSTSSTSSRTPDEMSHKSSLMPQRQQPQHYHYRSFSTPDSQAESRLHSDSGVGSSCSSNSSVGSLAAMNASSAAEERSASSRSSVSSAISSADEQHRTGADAAAIRHHELMAATENGADRLRQQSMPRRDRPVEHLQSVGSTNNNRNNLGVSASAAAAAAHLSALHQYHAAAATAAQYQNLMMKQFENSAAQRLHPQQQQPGLHGAVFLPPSGQGLMLQQQQIHPKNLMLAREREMENRARYLRDHRGVPEGHPLHPHQPHHQPHQPPPGFPHSRHDLVERERLIQKQAVDQHFQMSMELHKKLSLYRGSSLPYCDDQQRVEATQTQHLWTPAFASKHPAYPESQDRRDHPSSMASIPKSSSVQGGGRHARPSQQPHSVSFKPYEFSTPPSRGAPPETGLPPSRSRSPPSHGRAKADLPKEAAYPPHPEQHPAFASSSHAYDLSPRHRGPNAPPPAHAVQINKVSQIRTDVPDAPLDLGKKRPGGQPGDNEHTSSKVPRIEADNLLASDSVGSTSDLSRSSNDPTPSSNSQTPYVHNKKAWLKSYVAEPPKPLKVESDQDDTPKEHNEPISVSPAPKLDASVKAEVKMEAKTEAKTEAEVKAEVKTEVKTEVKAKVKTEVNGNGANGQSSEEGRSNSADKVAKRKKDVVAKKLPAPEPRPAGTRTSSRTKERKRYQDYGENGSSDSDDDSDNLVAFTPNRVGAGKRRGRKPKANGDKESSAASSRRNSSASRSRSGSRNNSRNNSRTNSPAPSRSANNSQKAKKVTPNRTWSLKRSGEPFLQMGTCFEVAPKLPKCRECRWAHRQRNKKMLNKFCRFYAFRRLRYTCDKDSDDGSETYQLVEAGFCDPTSDATAKEIDLWLPSTGAPQKNIPEMSLEQARKLLDSLRKEFQEVVKEEADAVNSYKGKDGVVAWKRVIQGVREMCDVCDRSLFNVHFACSRCGFVVCFGCYAKKISQSEDQKEDEDDSEDDDEDAWLLCNDRKNHDVEKLIAVKIIPADALEKMAEECTNTKGEEGRENKISPPAKKGKAEPKISDEVASLAKSSSDLFPKVAHSWSSGHLVLNINDSYAEASSDLFSKAWGLGVPVVLGGVRDRMDLKLWSPDVLADDCEDLSASCVDVSLASPNVRSVPLKRFWAGFSDVTRRKNADEIMVVKEWPEDLEESLPEQLIDLLENLPMPDYISKTGRFNATALVPDIFVRAELSPRVHLCYGTGASEATDRVGTIRLHSAVADTLYLLAHVDVPASKEDVAKAVARIAGAPLDQATKDRLADASGPPVGCVWHVFKAEHQDAIRSVAEEFSEAEEDEEEAAYLRPEVLRKLKEAHDIVPTAMVQFCGEAVVLPAGTIRQAKHIRSCVSVSLDFVSLEHVADSFHMTRRTEESSRKGGASCNPDPLQIKNLVYHAVKSAVSVIHSHKI